MRRIFTVCSARAATPGASAAAAASCPRQLGERGKNARPGADALVEALQVVLLVRRMDVVVFEPEADQERLEPQRLLEIGDDRDRGAGADQKRLLAPFLRQRLFGGGERLHVPVERDRRRQGMV